MSFLKPGSIGQQAEDFALDYLRNQGLALLERNYRSRYGEIDLIMREHDITVFAEVRYRSSDRYGGAVTSVDRRKQERLLATAQCYYKEKRPGGSLRFDVLALSRNQGGGFQIQWIKDAFRCS